MKRMILLVLTLFLSTLALADNNWELVRHEDDIQVFTRNVPDSLIKSAKGEVLISASMDDLLSVLEDVNSLPRWLFNCKSAKTLKQPSIVERYDYILTDIPWPNWDRDIIVRSVFQQDRKSQQLEITFDSFPNLVPLKPGIVRVKKMNGRMLLIPQNKNKIKVIYEMNVDPGGRIPKWLVNDMVTDFPFFSLKDLRELVEK